MTETLASTPAVTHLPSGHGMMSEHGTSQTTTTGDRDMTARCDEFSEARQGVCDRPLDQYGQG